MLPNLIAELARAKTDEIARRAELAHQRGELTRAAAPAAPRRRLPLLRRLVPKRS
jgi:hypothetical protein